MDGDPDRKATGFSVGQLPKSSAITPGGRDTYKTAQGYWYRDPSARPQNSASGICQSHPWLRQAGTTRTRSATTVAKAHHLKQEGYPNNTPRIPKGHPKETRGIAQRYPKDTRPKDNFQGYSPRVIKLGSQAS